MGHGSGLLEAERLTGPLYRARAGLASRRGPTMPAPVAPKRPPRRPDDAAPAARIDPRGPPCDKLGRIVAIGGAAPCGIAAAPVPSPGERPCRPVPDSPPPSPPPSPAGEAAGLNGAAPAAAPAQQAGAGPSGAVQARRRYTCFCGAGECGRAHHFDACPVARAVYASMQAALPAGAPSIQRWHVWLAEPPAGAGLHRGVWLVVCLAALTAMDTGRRCLVAVHLRREAERAANGGLRQTLMPEHFPPAAGGPAQAPPPPPPPPPEVAASRAVAEFWASLQDFAQKGLPERTVRAWRAAGVGPTHPFLGVSGEPPRVQLVGPAAPAPAATGSEADAGGYASGDDGGDGAGE